MKGIKEKTLIEEHYRELLNIMDTLKVGVFITDGQGNVLMVNKESERTGGGMSLDEILGKNMEYLQKVGYVDESSVLKAIESGEECRMIQKLADGGSLYVTAVPYIRDAGDVELVICTERDVTETKIHGKPVVRDKNSFGETGKGVGISEGKQRGQASQDHCQKQQYEADIEYGKKDSTAGYDGADIGEAGVGKEVIANYIFNMSNRDDKPFVKINCAAIPDNLLESELFGYEKGAFTGADTKGKAGLFEIANEGTLFLDEITEIPLKLQAKFLRVLQEREFMRIGGKESIKVNVRIIAATNRNLKEEVEQGNFREDLYYRLNVVPLEIPPLRDRKEDIEALAARLRGRVFRGVRYLQGHIG